MAIIVLLRGINVGAAGTLVVRRPHSHARLRAALRARLPVGAAFVLCESRELLRLAAEYPFEQPPPDGTTRFVSFLERRARVPPQLPLTIPRGQDWFVRVTMLTNRLAVGEYRRDMKTIGYLGHLDAIFGTLVTTRSWNTVNAIVRLLQHDRGRSARR